MFFIFEIQIMSQTVPVHRKGKKQKSFKLVSYSSTVVSLLILWLKQQSKNDHHG